MYGITKFANGTAHDPFAELARDFFGRSLRPVASFRHVGAFDLIESESAYTLRGDLPGIPEEKRLEVLKPFSRLDAARNQDSGPGVGLGLTIAADIARQHGGRLVLGESKDLGGLKAEIIIPK